jgi:hypothetical protein
VQDKRYKKETQDLVDTWLREQGRPNNVVIQARNEYEAANLAALKPSAQKDPSSHSEIIKALQKYSERTGSKYKDEVDAIVKASSYFEKDLNNLVDKIADAYYLEKIKEMTEHVSNKNQGNRSQRSQLIPTYQEGELQKQWFDVLVPTRDVNAGSAASSTPKRGTPKPNEELQTESSALKKQFVEAIHRVKATPRFDEELNAYKERVASSKALNSPSNEQNIQAIGDSVPGYIVVQALQDAYEADKWGLEKLLKNPDPQTPTMLHKAMERYIKHTMRPLEPKSLANTDEWRFAETTALQSNIMARQLFEKQDKIQELDDFYNKYTENYFEKVVKKLEDYEKKQMKGK